MDFAVRSKALELMDDPLLGKEALQMAYADINNCNRWLGGAKITVKAVRQLLAEGDKKSYTIYDMGCGDGFMLRQLADAFKNEDFTLQLVGFDLRPDIVALAQEASINYSNIEFRVMDIFDPTLQQTCDVLLCTLTLHHFKDAAIVPLCKKFGQLARLGVVINDLQRNPLAYRLFKWFSMVFITSDIAKTDGLISITRGFKLAEIQGFARRLSVYQHRIRWQWAFRYLWVITPLKNKV